MDFPIPADRRAKVKESEKRDKYLDLAWDLKKSCGKWRWQWYQLSLVHLGLTQKAWKGKQKLEIRVRIKTIKKTGNFKSAKLLKRVLKTIGYSLLFRLLCKTSDWRWYEKLSKSKIIIIETHKLLLEFEIQMDHLISARRQDLVIVNKKKENLPNCRICRLG